MGSTNKHLKRAQQHLEVASKIAADEDCRAWAAVVLFYSARDLVHALFDVDPDLPAPCRHPKSHTDQSQIRPGTNTVIKRHHRKLEVPYMTLYATSLGVRYEGQAVSAELYAELEADYLDLCKTVAWCLDAWGRQVPEWLAAAAGK